MQIEIKKPTEQELLSLGVRQWSIWEKEVSQFDWYYDQREICYFLAGEVEVKTKNGSVKITKGDLVIFPQGLECVWVVNQPVRKHYKFG